MSHVEPADFIVGHPQLRGLVHIDLASLLGIGLAELLADLGTLEAALEDAALAGQIGGTVETQETGQDELVRVQKMAVGVFGEIERVPLPVHLQAVRLGRQVAQRGAVVGALIEVLVFAVGRDVLAARLGRRAGDAHARLPGSTRRLRGEAERPLPDGALGLLGLRHAGGRPGGWPPRASRRGTAGTTWPWRHPSCGPLGEARAASPASPSCF